ncbi:MAG: hypothetical protein ACFFDI_01045 [Promethearchaeota archaeon]
MEATQNQELAITRPSKKAGHDIADGWHQVFLKILHHPKGLDSFSKQEHDEFNRFLNWRINETLWKGERIIGISGNKKEIRDDLKGRIILFLKGGVKKQHISVKKLLSLKPSELFKKVNYHAHNYLYYKYVGKTVRERKFPVGDSSQNQKVYKPEELKTMEIIREPAQEVTLTQARGDVDDELDSIEDEALSKVAEQYGDQLKKKKLPKWAREALEARIYHRTVSNIAKDKRISEEAAELMYEMDISARNKKRLIKRRR